jgi:nitroreductase
MDLFEAIRRRRSVRSFTSESIPERDLLTILEQACLAPSAGNVQPWRLVVVTDSTVKNRIARAALGQSFIATAPAVIVVCADLSSSAAAYGGRGVSLYSIQDTAAATQNILLAATALGYGSCWVGAFDEREVSQILGIPSEVRPVAVIPLGRPSRIPPQVGKKPLKAILHLERY